MLCRLAAESQYAAPISSTSYTGSTLRPFPEQLTNVQNAVSLLQMEYSSPTQFHPVTNSASQLLLMILPTIDDVAQRPRHELSTLYGAVQGLLNNSYRVPMDVKQFLENYLLSLSVLLHDDKATQQAQAMHTVHLPMGKSDIGGGNYMSSDLIMCGLVLHSLVSDVHATLEIKEIFNSIKITRYHAVQTSLDPETDTARLCPSSHWHAGPHGPHPSSARRYCALQLCLLRRLLRFLQVNTQIYGGHS